MLLTGLTPESRRQYLAPLAARDPEGFAALDEKVVKAAEAGWAMSIAEIDTGVCAIAAPVRSGPRVLAALTVPSPLTRTPPAVRDRRIAQVRAAATSIGSALAMQRDAITASRLCSGLWTRGSSSRGRPSPSAPRPWPRYNAR